MVRLEELVKSISTIFQAMKYGKDDRSKNGDSLPDIRKEAKYYLGATTVSDNLYNNGKKGQRSYNAKPHQRLNRKLSASEGNLSSSSKRVVTNSNVYDTTSLQRSLTSLNGKYGSDVPKVVAHVIQEASTPSPLQRQSIRVINGEMPSLQSQVLLNTKTSQPFEDLVRDLALSVRIPKHPLGNRLQTLAGRHIRSYSQLRSELRAGQRAFFIYSQADNYLDNRGIQARGANPGIIHPAKPNGNALKGKSRSRPIVKTALGKVDSNSSSDLSLVTQNRQRERKKSQNRQPSRSPTPSPRNMSRLSNSLSPTFPQSN